MPSQLPLFPLKIVPFPDALLPICLFEPRDRRLPAQELSFEQIRSAEERTARHSRARPNGYGVAR